MSEELKPCPFCGGAPKTSHRACSAGEDGKFIAFTACYCGGYSARAHQYGVGETVPDAIRQVSAKWNTRADNATIAELRAEVERLRKQEASAAIEMLAAHNQFTKQLEDGVRAIVDDRDKLRKALAGMLFAFDDGVGQDWSESLLNFARTLTPAEEYKA
jgi:hypothetical protein